MPDVRRRNQHPAPSTHLPSFLLPLYSMNYQNPELMKTTGFYRYFSAVLLGFISFITLHSQEKSVKYDLAAMLANNQLEIFNRKVSSFSEDGKNGIRFSKNEADGVAWLKHVIFSNGSIEVDIKGSNELQQSFVGIAFHGMDNNTFDAVYFRPFNFQADDPVRKIHAVQYISLPENDWAVLREKFNGKYEKAVSPSPDPDKWFHVKITIKSPQVDVFVNGSQTASLTVDKLNNRASGKIGLWVGNNSAGDFANLQIE